MYISEVSGHHSATIAIEKAIKKISPSTQVLNINAFNYTNPISEKIINRLYLTVIKNTPKIWDYLYDNPKVVKKLDSIKKTIHKLNSPKLKNLFDKFKPDVVACTQAFPCGMVADYKKIYSSNVPLIAILTDYIPHAYWVYDTIDYYITPSEEVGSKLEQKGIPHSKIKPFGIPFDPKFNSVSDKKEVVSKLGLEEGLPVILVMGGGQGLGPIKTIVKSLDKLQVPAQFIVVTGSNKKLFNSLARKTRKSSNKFRILGYVDNVNELMDISTLIITKPGGITTAEALAKNLPMIIISPIPGQEEKNTEYLTKIGAAIRVDDLEAIDLTLSSLLSSPQKLNIMRNCVKTISKPNSSLDIAKLILNNAND